MLDPRIDNKTFDLEKFLASPKTSDYLADSPIRVLVEWFLEERRALNLQPSSIEFYSIRLDYLCALIGNKKATEISSAHLRAVVQHLKDSRKWSLQNTNHFIQIIRSFFKYLEDEEVVAVSPARKIRKMRMPSRLPQTCSGDEVNP